MTSFLWTLLPLGTIIGLGVLLCRLARVDVHHLARAALYLFTPCLVFRSLLRADVASASFGRVVLVVLLLFVVLGAALLFMARLLRWPRDRTAANLLVLLFMNAGNFGLSFNRLQYGEAGMDLAIVYFMTNVILLNTLGTVIAARGKASWRETAVSTLKIPLIYAVLVALLFRWLGVPAEHRLLGGINLIADATVPLLLVILGAQISSVELGKDLYPVAVAGLLRLFLSPLVAFLLATLLGLSGLALKVVIIQSAMPAAVNSLVLALRFDTRPQFVGSVILVTTVVSLLTLGGLVMVL